MQENITIHYDKMIIVEGCVYKSFSREFKKDSDEIYKKVVNKLAKDLQLHGVNVVRRPTLPMVK